MTKATHTIVLSSGGTGGHVFPALSLAEELHGRGYEVVIMTDHRGKVFQSATGVSKVIALPTWKGRGRLGTIVLGAGLAISFLLALAYMVRSRPAVVLGFGGYPSLPAVLAGYVMRIPTALHEQNAILGRANRLMVRFVTRLGLSYKSVKFTESFQDKIVQTGNPVRKSIIAIRDVSYHSPKAEEPFRLLVVGGSQGARVFSSIVPQALCGLPMDLRKRLVVYQQCRKEFLDATIAAYHQSGIFVDIRPFFENMDQQLRDAHLVIGRSGASTVAELTVSGRPALLVPFPFAMDNHQQANAVSLAEEGAAWVVLEPDFTPQKLQELLLKAMKDDKTLTTMAQKMHGLGHPDAAEKLAGMGEGLLKRS